MDLRVTCAQARAKLRVMISSQQTSVRPRRLVLATLTLTALLAASFGVGCTTLKTAFSEDGVLYKKTAQENYDAGQKALKDKSWEDASKYFNQVKTKFPYSKFAVLAALGIADADFGNEKYLQAADGYQRFMRMHPRHAKVPYASFKVAESYYKRMPERWIFLPPVEEKDQSAVYQSEQALQAYLARFPKDQQAEKARELLADVHTRLIENELYAADFYARSEHWRAVAWRCEKIAERFPQAEQAPAALLRAGQAWEKLGDLDQALAQYRRVISAYPSSAAAEKAKKVILEAEQKAKKAPAPSSAS